MSIESFLLYFQDHNELPVKLSLVSDWIIENNYQDEIYFIEVDLDPEKLRGFVKKYRVSLPYGDAKNVANVYFAKDMSEWWKNFVCMKELFHCFNTAWPTDTIEKVLRLAEQLAMPARMESIIQEDDHVRDDRFGELYALAMAFPWKKRQQLMPRFQAGVITIADIAELVNIPESYARAAMHSAWETVYRQMIGPTGP